MVIEKTFSSNDYDLSNLSFYIIDSRISVITVVAVYIKKFFIDSTTAYYVELSEWQETHAPEGYIWAKVSPGFIMFSDINRDLQGETLTVVITQ